MIKHILKLKFIYFFSSIIFIFLFFLIAGKVIADTNPNFQIQIVTFCGNNYKEAEERCDGTDLNGSTCLTHGFNGGVLSCTSSCTFDTSACFMRYGKRTIIDSTYVPPSTYMIFEGKAYPNSLVTLLKDAQIATTTVADANANFQINISDISGGNYIFAFYSEDGGGNRSSLLTFSGTITSGATNRVSGIYIAPTILIDKNKVKQGDNILISGQSYPNSNVNVQVDPNVGSVRDIQTDVSGKYSYNFNTSLLGIGTNFIKTKSTINTDSSSYSTVISFDVGDKNVLVSSKDSFLKGDLNSDGRVNLIDFSIAAYWYKRPLDISFKEVENKRLNGDEKIDLTDFSIMAFNWTG